MNMLYTVLGLDPIGTIVDYRSHKNVNLDPIINWVLTKWSKPGFWKWRCRMSGYFWNHANRYNIFPIHSAARCQGLG